MDFPSLEESVAARLLRSENLRRSDYDALQALEAILNIGAELQKPRDAVFYQALSKASVAVFWDTWDPAVASADGTPLGRPVGDAHRDLDHLFLERLAAIERGLRPTLVADDPRATEESDPERFWQLFVGFHLAGARAMALIRNPEHGRGDEDAQDCLRLGQHFGERLYAESDPPDHQPSVPWLLVCFAQATINEQLAMLALDRHEEEDALVFYARSVELLVASWDGQLFRDPHRIWLPMTGELGDHDAVNYARAYGLLVSGLNIERLSGKFTLWPVQTTLRVLDRFAEDGWPSLEPRERHEADLLSRLHAALKQSSSEVDWPRIASANQSLIDAVRELASWHAEDLTEEQGVVVDPSDFWWASTGEDRQESLLPRLYSLQGYASGQSSSDQLARLMDAQQRLAAEQRLTTYFFRSGLWSALPPETQRALVSADELMFRRVGRVSDIFNELRIATVWLCHGVIWDQCKEVPSVLAWRASTRSDWRPDAPEYIHFLEQADVRNRLRKTFTDDEVTFLTHELHDALRKLNPARRNAEHPPLVEPAHGAVRVDADAWAIYAQFLGVGTGPGILQRLARIWQSARAGGS